jgi:hypothetical protein
LFAAVACGMHPSFVRADEPVPSATTVAGPATNSAAVPKTVKFARSPLERRLMDSVAKDLKGVEDLAPEGKIIESIKIERIEVLDRRDDLPGFVQAVKRPINALHGTTREFVVERELLQKKGDRFQAALADETERNLRRLSGRISLAMVFALRGSAPDRVVLCVITKDLWSLRLSYDPAIVARTKPSFGPGFVGVAGVAAGVPGALAAALFNYGKLESLVLAPSETNVAGLHHTASLSFTYLPESFGFGARYAVPRFGTSYVSAGASGGLVVNQRSGELEGGSLSLSVERPLYTTQTEWSWGLSGSISRDVFRRYSKGEVFLYDSPKTNEKERIRFEYKRGSLGFGASVTRSYGWVTKQDLSFGVGYRDDFATPFDLSGASPTAATDFLSRVPRSDRRIGPSATYRTYTSNFHRITDFETLGIQEDYRLGHDAYLRAGSSFTDLGASRTFLSLSAGAQYTLGLGDGILRTAFEAQADVDFQQVWDAATETRIKLASPRFGIGRLVVDTALVLRPRNYLNRQTTLGGEGRLRGYPSRFFQGKDAVLLTLEYRSRPVRLWTFFLGGAVFYDAGNVFDGFATLRPKQAAGLGARLLIPQFNRTVFRADVAFPLAYPLERDVAPVGFFMSFEQATDFSGTFGP